MTVSEKVRRFSGGASTYSQDAPPSPHTHARGHFGGFVLPLDLMSCYRVRLWRIEPLLSIKICLHLHLLKWRGCSAHLQLLQLLVGLLSTEDRSTRSDTARGNRTLHSLCDTSAYRGLPDMRFPAPHFFSFVAKIAFLPTNDRVIKNQENDHFPSTLATLRIGEGFFMCVIDLRQSSSSFLCGSR